MVTYDEWNRQTKGFVRFFVNYRSPTPTEEEYTEGEEEN
jgi:hypothetical protein